MKTHHYIFLTTLIFVIVFYNEDIGLNLGIVGIAYAVLALYKTPGQNKTREFLIIFVMSILSSIAFAWYGDFASFLAVLSSHLLLAYRSRNRKMKILLLIPVFVVNGFTFICRFFNFDKWLPKTNTSGLLQKVIAFVLIPLILVAIFFGIYAAGSSHFADLFSNYEWDVNIWQLIVITVLGFFIAFNYWNFAVERLIYRQNHILDNEFGEAAKIQKPTYSFLDLNSERMSGVISLFCLNILLAVFIFTFNYEQFVEVQKTTIQLGEETHERVNAVILSIIMAILVIMMYFKGGFNFDVKAKSLKILAKVWIFLNVILIISAFVKNTEYIIDMGFTYKKMGVYAFLILSLIGLILTFIKIHTQKTNAYLFNSMVWAVYGTVLACSFINWGGIITMQNSKRSDFAVNFHLHSISFSEKQLIKYAEEKKDEKLLKEVTVKTEQQKQNTFLSKILFYETTKTK
ncbi:DUF4153 domain-containing protein [Chryseobacterium caseinilyticum]|uniref:DUF4173 domain-containing protein n=1 Tax=Chryseobacterium caseinilyticum TaxID=2771428 RepID=A0ABR8ZE57_9FLAO|nr:DUF4153 domain-containing protein [Chryseobacterium caseinilyticum]MBD8083369.1 DUF4173 domain-containing protein [Chryseobacterium caseinilyticum]